MTIQKQVKRQEQLLARCEKSLVLEKLKKRRADTRRKIELGGLVIKAGIDEWDRATILGVLDYAAELLRQNELRNLFQLKGKNLFVK